MRSDDFKKSISSVEPDDYMKTRLFAKVSEAEMPKHKSRKMIKAAVSAALCCAIIAAGLGIAIPQSIVDDATERVSDTNSSGNVFIMSVAAAENSDDENLVYTPIDDNTVTLPDFKLEKDYSSTGELTIGYGSTSNLAVSGKNIKSVKYSCETGGFNVWDWDMKHYLIQNNCYFDAIVPYTDEYKGKGANERLDIMLNHIENGDYDEYFTVEQKKPLNEYCDAARIYYDDLEYYGIKMDFEIDEANLKEDDIIAIGLVSNEKAAMFSQNLVHDCDKPELKEYTFRNVLNKTDAIGDMISWDPSTDVLFDNPNASLSDVPHDTITVEVTFNDGSVQYGKYDFSFNDNGNLIINKI